MADSGRRRRLQNACDECRRRRIRCNSATAPGNICSNCLSFKVDCTHLMLKKKRGPKTRFAQDDAIRSLVNTILSPSKPYVVPEDPEKVREVLFDLARYARSLDRQLSSIQANPARADETETTTETAPSHDSGPSTSRKRVVDSIDSLTQELDRVSLNDYKRYEGRSSNILLVRAVMDTRRDAGGPQAFTQAVFQRFQRPEFWQPSSWQQTLQPPSSPFVFPPDDLLQDLINLYFSAINPFIPMLHKPTFERAISDGLHLRSRPFGATVLAVCGIASRQSSDPRNLCENTTSEHSVGWKYFRQIPLIRPELYTERPSLYDIQLCALSVFYLQATPKYKKACWTLAGMGIRFAHEIGIHRKSTSRKNTVEDELLKRAFWVLVLADLHLSAFLGRPRATNSDEFDIELPVECDDGYWENPDPEKAFLQPEGKPSVLSFFVSFLRLLEIFGYVQRALYSIRKSELWYLMGVSEVHWKEKAVIELDSALTKFLSEVPDHLKWNPEISDPIFLQQSAILHSSYYWVQIQVHRPFIPRPGQQPVLPFPSLAITTKAAQTITDILEVFHARRELWGLFAIESIPNLLMPLYVAAMVLLVGAWNPQRTSGTEEMTNVYRCLRLIKLYERRSQTAGCIVDVMNAIITIGQNSSARQTRSSNEAGGSASSSAPSHLRSDLGAINEEPYLDSFDPDTSASSNIPSQPFHPSVDDVLSSSPLLAFLNDTGIDPLNTNQGTDHDLGFLGESDLSSAPLFMSMPEHSMWDSTPSALGNAEFTQEGWNPFTASIEGLLAGTVEYQGFLQNF